MATRRMQAKRRTAPKPTRGGSSGGGNPRNSRETSEQQHEDAMRVLRAEYYSGVRSIAQDIIERARAGDFPRREDELNDALHQSVEGSYWVIYTHANFQVLLCSDHHDAYSEDFGQPPVSGNDIDWAALAYAAMMRDVQEQIETEGGVEFGTVEEARSRHGRMREDVTMSISEIGSYLRGRRVSASEFWQDAMGGDMAPLPRKDVIRIADKIARRGR